MGELYGLITIIIYVEKKAKISTLSFSSTRKTIKSLQDSRWFKRLTLKEKKICFKA